jgi:5-methylcytosine-specific restriction enzyme subunit McrC
MWDGLRITTRSWVGVIRFHGFELQVVPKLVGDNLGLVELIDYAAGLDALDRHPAVRTLKGSGTCLFDLLALLLVEACERVVRNGLLSDYCEVEEEIAVVRGRLLVQKQLLKRFGRIDRLECRYDEYLTDIVENRILLAALSVCANRVGHPAVAMRVRRVLAIFSEVCDLPGLNLRLARSSLVYNRMNEHYREPHELAWLILDGLGIEDIFAAGSQRCFAFLLNMNRLFERFIIRWLRQMLAGSEFRVIPPRRDRTILWNAELARPYASVIPDLLIESTCQPGWYLPVDAKYKLYDQRNIATGDIYQTFLYAYAYGEKHPALPTAFVLYPASSPGGGQVLLHVRRSGGATSAQLRAIPVHIPTALAEARLGRAGSVSTGLVDLVKKAFAAGTPQQGRQGCGAATAK